MDTALLEETYCGQFCQHPPCWNSQRRIVRGTPHKKDTINTLPVKDVDEDDSLPTQKIVNLLADYGKEPRDRFQEIVGPYKLRRAIPGESFSKVRTPNATPASPLYRSTQNQRITSLSFPVPTKSIGKVEVQELFDVDDLQNDWHDTFKPKRCYVWVANTKKKQLSSIKRPNSTIEEKIATSGAPPPVKIKNVTEDMVPVEIEMIRQAAIVHRPRKEPMSLWNSMQYYFPNCRCETPKPKFNQTGGKYYGIYDLLDLPREVLSDILKHITESELMDRRKFADALIRVLPKLEKDNSAVALAYSDVLKQQPVKLCGKSHDIQSEKTDGSSKPVYLLSDGLDTISEKCDDTYRSNITAPHNSIKANTSQVPTTFRETDSPTSPSPTFKKPLPAIQVPTQSEIKETPTLVPPTTAPIEIDDPIKSKIPNISLGLPEIQRGMRHTKTFTYKKNDNINLTLAPVVSVSLPVSVKAKSLDSTPRSFKTGPSTVYVSVPIVMSDRDEPIAGLLDRTTKNDVVDMYNTSYTGRIPEPPVNTPNFNNSVPPASRTPDGTGLEPIRETQSVKLASSHRNVRFATLAIPQQPPCSPTELSDRSISPQTLQLVSKMKPVEEDSETTLDLIVIGHGAGMTTATPSKSHMDSSTPQQQPATPADTREQEIVEIEFEDDTIITHKNEDNDLLTPTTTRSPSQLDVAADQSIVVNYDVASEHSGITAMMPRTAPESRESSVHSEQVNRMWHEGKLPQSPAPPPPSPEAKDLIHELHSADNIQYQQPQPDKDNSQLAALKELTETDSEITITALPPSNLDDISRINTPSSLASRSLVSRENTNISGVPKVDTVLEESKQPDIEEPWSVGQNLKPQQSTNRLVVHESNVSNNPAKNITDTIEYDKETQQNNIAEKKQSLNNASDKQHGTVIESEPANISANTVHSDVKIRPLEPMNNKQDHVKQETADQLDQFEVNEEMLKKELQNELDKLE